MKLFEKWPEKHDSGTKMVKKLIINTIIIKYTKM